MSEFKPTSKPRNIFGCTCDSFLARMLEHSGQRLIQRRAFLQYTLGSAGLLALTTACAAPGEDSEPTVPTPSIEELQQADKIFFGGSILTMVADGDRVEALAVKNGKIIAAGDMDTVQEFQDSETEMVNLEGNCLMPGFVDPHSHVVFQSAKFATVNLDPVPIGDIASIEDIQAKLSAHIDDNEISPGSFVIGWGYDDTAPEGMRHPYKMDLDMVSTEHPILLMHISGHLCACNSLLLEMAEITEETPDPEGGRIQRIPGTTEPNGVLEELAMNLVLKLVPTPTPEEAIEMIKAGLDYYAAAGITTAQDGASSVGSLALLEQMAEAGQLPIDVVAYPIYIGLETDEMNEEVQKILADLENLDNADGSAIRFRRGGIKLTVDGSIQGYTAFLCKPYYVQPGDTATRAQDKCSAQQVEHFFISAKNGLDNLIDISVQESEIDECDLTGDVPEEGYRGYANMEQVEIEDWMRFCDHLNIPMLAHTNGDAATELLIEATKTVREDIPRPDLRTTIIHAQTMREDQLDFASDHGLVPSFFPIHVVYWGDRHRDIFLGPDRAARISPAKSALNRDMKFTLHHDAPIAGIGMLPVAAAAVNRLTSSCQPLGLDQKITAFEALRAITADAAWQYFEEDRKGTLEVGKFADLVILSDDPLAIDPLEMTNIQVLETLKEGETIFELNTPTEPMEVCEVVPAPL